MNKTRVYCPKCKKDQEIAIPKNKCLVFFECENCRQLIQAEKKCCIICDYSKVKCPVPHIR